MRNNTILNRSIFFLLQKSLFVLDKSAEMKIKEAGTMTLAQMHVLVIIYGLQCTSQQVVAAMLQNTQASVSRQVALLLRKKLITRTQNPHNKREYRLALTAQGEILMKENMQTLDAHFEQIFSVVGALEKKMIISTFEKLIGVVQNMHTIDDATCAHMAHCQKNIKERLQGI